MNAGSAPCVGTLSSDVAYPLSPPVSEGGTREDVLASDVDISVLASDGDSVQRGVYAVEGLCGDRIYV